MIEYRKANIDDLTELVKLRLEFLFEANNGIVEINLEHLRDEITNYLSDAMKTNDFISWLAINNGTVIATSGLSFYRVPPAYKNITGNVAYIMNMYTKPDFRKQGIAENLLDKIVGEAKHLGYKNVVLHATEMGRPLYEKFGFTAGTDEMVLDIR